MEGEILLPQTLNCRICEGKNEIIFSKKILFKYDINYYHCKNCGFVQTETPYWLKESYLNPINFSDTGIVARNLTLTRICSSLIYLLFKRNNKFLDFAGGYGFFTRIMRDIGFDFYWKDIYTSNLLARGFEWNDTLKIELLTAFEVFEHLEFPLKELEEMLKISNNILFSTEIIPKENQMNNWWYLATEHGQHIAFYSETTLKFIAEKYKLYFYSNSKNIHLFSKKKQSPFKIRLLFESKNNRPMSLISKIIKLGMFKYITYKMNSKTVADMNLIIHQMKNRSQ